MTSSGVYGFHIPPSEEPSPAGVWQGLKENTTAHGIPHINNAKGIIKKTLWSMISAAVLGAMIYHLYSLFNTYFQYKVNVHIDIISKTHVVFPAVTVCNMNPIKNSQLSRSEALSFLLSNGQSKRRRRKRQTSGSIELYRLENRQYYFLNTLYDTSTNLGTATDDVSKIVIAGESAWVLSALDDVSQFFCPGSYEEDMGWTTVLNRNTDAIYKISHACGEPEPASGSIDSVSNGNTCERDYTIDCNSATPFKDGQTRKTLTCSASSTEYGGSMDMSQISDCFDAVILYENADKSGANFIVTSDSEVSFHWRNRASAVTITGPNHWVLYTDSSFSTGQDYFSFCPGEYQATADFDDNSINSMARGTGPLCPTVQTHSNTQYIVDSTTSCWSVTYTCDSGYSFSDGSSSNILTCTGGRNLASGTWTGSVPLCEAETTTAEDTTTVQETTTVEETTTVQETTTIQETTTVQETTTMEETTTVEETTTIVHTTTVDDTTTVAETSSMLDPTTTSEETTTEKVTSTAVTTTTTTYPPELGEPKREDFLLQENVIETLANMPEEEKSSLGYQSTDMLLDCAYEGSNCDLTRDFSQFYDPVLGNCYTFNSGRDDVDLVYSHRTGQRYGLGIIINIDQSEYTDNLRGPAGARIVIHDQHVMPFPNDVGILARPGELLSVGVKKVNVIRRPHPYGNCTTDYHDESLDMYIGLYGVEYTEMGCIKTCYQLEVVEQCGCGDPSYPLYGRALGGDTIASCSTQDLDQVACQIQLEEAFTAGNIECECPERCSDSYYTSDVSTAEWPSLKHQDAILEELTAKNPNFTVPSNFTVEDNLLKLEVYFQEFNFEEITEKPAYVISQLMSDLGGAFGLWFGLSILSFFEFFEFFLDMAVVGCFRCCRKAPGPKRPWQPPHPKHRNQLSRDIQSPPPQYKSVVSVKSRRIRPLPDAGSIRDVPGAPCFQNYVAPDLT